MAPIRALATNGRAIVSTFFLFTPDQSKAYSGSYAACASWGVELTRTGEFTLLKIALGRAGEPKAVITADVANGIITRASGSRAIDNIYKLTRVCSDAPLVP